MQAIRLVRRISTNGIRRQLSSSPPVVTTPSPSAVAPVKETVQASSVSISSSFFDRFFSFLVGGAVGFGFCSYFVEEELQRSNAAFTATLDELTSRIIKLESAK
jgi:hypothetical protein